MKTEALFFIFAIISLTMLMPELTLAEPDPTQKITLSNPGFEADKEEPWYWWGNAGTGTYGSVEYAHTGRKSVKIVADGGDYIPMGCLQDFECKAGDKIIVSCWVMSPNDNPLTNSNAFVKLEFWGEGSSDLIKGYESGHLTGAFDWKEISVSGEAPKGTVKAKIGLFIWNPGTNHSGSVYFDDAKASRTTLLF